MANRVLPEWATREGKERGLLQREDELFSINMDFDGLKWYCNYLIYLGTFNWQESGTSRDAWIRCSKDLLALGHPAVPPCSQKMVWGHTASWHSSAPPLSSPCLVSKRRELCCRVHNQHLWPGPCFEPSGAGIPRHAMTTFLLPTSDIASCTSCRSPPSGAKHPCYQSYLTVVHTIATIV